MKYPYSGTSKRRLNECDDRLINVFNAVAEQIDTTIICGHRRAAEQEKAFADGKSKVEWPNSKHNGFPSKAVDAIPYDKPLPWADRERATYFAGIVMATAHAQGVKLRWGGDWDMDNEVADNKFDDLWHFEVVEPERTDQ